MALALDVNDYFFRPFFALSQGVSKPAIVSDWHSSQNSNGR